RLASTCCAGLLPGSPFIPYTTLFRSHPEGPRPPEKRHGPVFARPGPGEQDGHATLGGFGCSRDLLRALPDFPSDSGITGESRKIPKKVPCMCVIDVISAIYEFSTASGGMI